jgi:multicomponent Na+:H+ antiporter subunit B
MRLAGFILIGLLTGFFIWASGDLPERGDPNAPASVGVATYYIENAYTDSRTPNMVTAVLADYRGFDTFGEAVVVTAAALSCLLILLRRRRREDGTEGGLFPELDDPDAYRARPDAPAPEGADRAEGAGGEASP